MTNQLPSKESIDRVAVHILLSNPISDAFELRSRVVGLIESESSWTFEQASDEMWFIISKIVQEVWDAHCEEIF